MGNYPSTFPLRGVIGDGRGGVTTGTATTIHLKRREVVHVWGRIVEALREGGEHTYFIIVRWEDEVECEVDQPFQIDTFDNMERSLDQASDCNVRVYRTIETTHPHDA
jgi:hypothetical protein